MTRNLKFFFIGFIFSLPIFWGANVFEKNLEDFLFWGKMADNPQLLAAQIIQEDKLEQLKPIRNWQVSNLEILAKSAISILFKPDGTQKILFEKESEKPLPIASLTKLMTANVIFEHYNLFQPVQISKKAVETEEDFGNFKIGEIFLVKDLLYPLLIESSNDAAIALTEVIGEKGMVELMNLEAENLGLKNTYFFNPTGLDPDDPTGPLNYSTAQDLAKLAKYILETKPLIWEISSLPEFNLFLADGRFHHQMKNTNEILKDFPEIIGSKTGWTPEAQGCLLLVIKAPQNRGVIINVILGSPDRFGEMKELINWSYSAYKW